MKKIIGFSFLVMLGLLMNLSALAQDEKIPVEVVNSNNFSVKKVSLMERNGNLQLHFSVANKSKQISPGVEVVLSAYNKSGNLKARHTWATSEEMSVDSKLFSVFDVSSGLKGAFRYTVEFLVPTETQNDDACTTCTDNAIRACNGKVKSVDCRLGENGTYNCSYECKAEELNDRSIVKDQF